MLTKPEQRVARKRAADLLGRTGIAIRPEELHCIEVVDFGFGDLENIGVQILTSVSTSEVAVKLLILFPHQTEPEHRHPPLDDYPGKQETLRCEWGELYLYTSDQPTLDPSALPRPGQGETYTVRHEHVLHPGEQISLAPNTRHWFQGGPDGAVVWTFSTKAVDIKDVFTDPNVVRETVIADR